MLVRQKCAKNDGWMIRCLCLFVCMLIKQILNNQMVFVWNGDYIKTGHPPIQQLMPCLTIGELFESNKTTEFPTD